ncbi:hypothetical protein ACFQXA_26065 [Nocardiopsis composta]
MKERFTPVTDRLGRLRGTVAVIMAVLVLAQALVPFAAHAHAAAAALPLLLWGAVGWALQVPQQQRLLGIAGERRGGVAVALNNSALYLGSAAGRRSAARRSPPASRRGRCPGPRRASPPPDWSCTW